MPFSRHPAPATPRHRSRCQRQPAGHGQDPRRGRGPGPNQRPRRGQRPCPGGCQSAPPNLRPRFAVLASPCACLERFLTPAYGAGALLNRCAKALRPFLIRTGVRNAAPRRRRARPAPLLTLPRVTAAPLSPRLRSRRFEDALTCPPPRRVRPAPEPQPAGTSRRTSALPLAPQPAAASRPTSALPLAPQPAAASRPTSALPLVPQPAAAARISLPPRRDRPRSRRRASHPGRQYWATPRGSGRGGAMAGLALLAGGAGG